MDGNTIRHKEITGTKAGSSARKIRTAHDEILLHLQKDDIVAIEFFALEGQDTNRIASGYNWGSRLAVDRICTNGFISPEPNRLKQFLNVSEWEGEKNLRRIRKAKRGYKAMPSKRK